MPPSPVEPLPDGCESEGGVGAAAGEGGAVVCGDEVGSRLMLGGRVGRSCPTGNWTVDLRSFALNSEMFGFSPLFLGVALLSWVVLAFDVSSDMICSFTSCIENLFARYYKGSRQRGQKR